MRQVAILAIATSVLVGLGRIHSVADEPKAAEAKQEIKLVGSWKLISAKFGGQEVRLPEGSAMVKHITPAQFMWAMYDKEGKVSRAAGGTYTLKGEQYEELPEYGVSDDFEIIKGKPQSFHCAVDGKRWHHDGKLSNGLTIEEVWERIDKK